MTEKDLTEKMLTAVYNDLADQLKKLKRGDPAHVNVMASLLIAKKELEDYKKKK